MVLVVFVVTAVFSLLVFWNWRVGNRFYAVVGSIVILCTMIAIGRAFHLL